MSRLEAIVAWILLAVAAALLHFSIVLQSDALFYDDLFTDLIVHGGAWSDWKFSAAPGFLPDMALYLLGFSLLPDASSRLLFVSVVQAVALAGLSVALARRLTQPGADRIDAQVILAVAFATLVSAQSGMWLYFHTTNNHFGTVLFALLATLLVLRLARRFSWPHALGLVAIVATASASSRLFLLTFTLPCLVVAGGTLVLALRGKDRRLREWHAGALARLIALLVSGQALAMLLERLLIHHVPVEGRPPLSVESISTSITFFTEATVAAFSRDNAATLLLALVLSACLLYLLARLLHAMMRVQRHPDATPSQTSTSDHDLQAVGALLCVALPLTIAGSVLSGAIVDMAGHRYLAFPLVLVVLLTLLFANRDVRRPRIAHTAWAACAVLVAGNALYVASNAPQRSDPPTAVAQCIAAAAAQGFHFEAGIADYWNARAVTYQLPDHNPITTTLHNLTPLFWVSTLGPLAHPDQYPRYHYNFAILRNPGTTSQFNYTPDTIGRLLPPPARIQHCADGITQLWLYDDARLHTTVRAAIDTFMNQRKNNP